MFIQFIGLLAFLFLLASFWNKNRKRLLTFQIIDSILYALHYFLLGAVSGFIINVIGIIRAFVFSKKEEKEIYNSKILLFFFLFLYLISGYIIISFFAVPNILHLFPILAALIYTLIIWNKDTKTIRRGNLFISIIWIIYNYIVGSYIGIITETILFISTLFSILKLDSKNL